MKRAWMAGMSLLSVVVALGLALTGSVPLGPALAQLEDTDRIVHWSELVVSSPAVVSVIGPY